MRLACERHLADIKHAKARHLVWKPKLAARAIAFFAEMLTLDDGRAFILEPFQAFIVGSLFGWFTAAGSRRFRTAYIEIAKGNGKSPLGAGVGIYGLVADGRSSAEIYSAATGREQARICFNDAMKMVKRSDELSDRVSINVASLSVPETFSSFKPVSSEHKGLDGKRVHMALVDELHEHPDAMVVDKMRAGTKGDPNALIFEITNSGYDRHSVCWQHHQYSVQVLEGTAPNQSWFAFVCGLDVGDAKTPGDDWRDPKVWIKANPNLGVSVTTRYLAEQVQEAEGMPSKQNIVRRLNFCEWTEQANRWLDLTIWDKGAGAVPLPELLGRPVFMGLDLASTTDLTALALLFPLERDRFALRLRFWMPLDNVQKRVKADHVPYDVWIRDGLIQTTPGNIVDYEAIRAGIQEEAARFLLRDLAYDRWNATHLITELQQEWPEDAKGDGPQVVPFGQGYASMAAPTKEFEKLLLAGRLLHGGNPVLRWMAANVSVRQDPAGNLKPDKASSTERIDGIVAAIMALGRAIVRPDTGPSVYESDSMLFLGGRE